MANTPLEVEMLIIEWVYRLSQARTVDYTTLYACALVCRAWTPTAQRLLFRRMPRLGIAGRVAPSVIRILRTNPHLAAAVRSVSLEVAMDEATSTFSDDVALLELCPQVQGIHIVDNQMEPSMYPAVESRLRAIQVHPVFLYPRHGGWPDFFPVLLRVWPNIRVLDLDDFRNESLPPISTPGGLQALRLASVTDISWELSPGNDFTALRDLELGFGDWGWRNAWWRRPDISRVLSRLHTLRLGGYFPPQEFLEQLGGLESLCFRELPREDIVLPPRLRHVGYRDWRPCPVDHAIDYVVAALHPLANLQVVSAPRCVAKAHIKALEEFCQNRGVVLDVREDPRDFPNPRYDVDWI
ncbi:hypothetical protein FA95DRAFT_1612435 [Auriscalpium vulgare]|uniref:Uncharacterized protein n=1 Tax=Auriscalpium vulgare TaxID=40419 RepID=A0ACB8R659_9AGAM|nr:hypothetical protein FA95DRAFT_1612435 [Auriscalpium vulgare]